LEFVEGLVDKSAGDFVPDYRKGSEQLVEDIRAAVSQGENLLFALDAVSRKG
jgi:NADPH:quinone reductase